MCVYVCYVCIVCESVFVCEGLCVCMCMSLSLFGAPSAAEGEFYDPPDRETMRLQKFGKLLAGPNTDLGRLK